MSNNSFFQIFNNIFAIFLYFNIFKCNYSFIFIIMEIVELIEEIYFNEIVIVINNKKI